MKATDIYISAGLDKNQITSGTLVYAMGAGRPVISTPFTHAKEIINSDEMSIERYKNLRYDLSEYKRAHIAKSFVLLFKFSKKEKFILFDKFGHHDSIYKV